MVLVAVIATPEGYTIVKYGLPPVVPFNTIESHTMLTSADW